MAANNFNPCLAITLKHEGGYSNHPADPGGVTLEGVIQTVYNSYRDKKGLPRQALTKAMRYTPEWIAERNEIYRAGYWNVVSGDSLAAGVDLATFDFGVNSGPARALKHLKAVLGGAPVDTVKRLCKSRMGFLQALRTWSVFGTGWGRRVADVEAAGVKMALVATGALAVDVSGKLDAEAKAASASSKKNSGAAAASAAPASTQTPAAPIDVSGWDLSTKVGIAIVVVALVAFFAWWAVQHYQRSQAYKAAAQEA